MRMMASLSERRVRAVLPARMVNWRGRSGRFYALAPERFDSFALAPEGLYMLAKGTLPMWVWSSHDVIHVAASRARLRLALAAADRAFAIEGGDDELGRMTMIWDLEGAEPVSGLSAA